MKKTDLKERIRIVGLKLRSGRNPYTAISVLDYFKSSNRIFLVKFFSSIKSANEYDSALIEVLNNVSSDYSTSLVSNAGLSLPPCIKCSAKCMGIDKCKKEEIKYIRDSKLKINKKNIIFTPYTQRACDVWLKLKNLHLNICTESLGSNNASLTTRMLYISKVVKDIDFYESNIDVVLFHILKELKLPLTYLKQYKSIIVGVRVRRLILEAIEEAKYIFLYSVDVEQVVLNIDLFDAFILSICGTFLHMNKVALFDRMVLPVSSPCLYQQ